MAVLNWNERVMEKLSGVLKVYGDRRWKTPLCQHNVRHLSLLI